MEPYATGFDAAQMVAKCGLAELMKLGRPEDLHVQKQWMLRFIAEMHWLPLIEVVSGCHAGTDPSAHAAFMKQMEALKVSRIAHQTVSILDREAWGRHLNRELKVRVPDPAKWSAVTSQNFRNGMSKRDILFVGEDCVTAAEEARPDCLVELPWLLYKAVSVVKGQLDQDGHRVMMTAIFGDDPSSKAYWRLMKEGRL